MKLANAYRYFDTESAYDAYSGSFLFKCQFSSFDDSTSSGATARRRVLGVDPSVTLPSRGVVTLFGDAWIIGDRTADGFKGNEIRNQINMKKALGLFSILTPSEACLNSSGISAYAATAYFKDTVDTVSNSDYNIFWNIFFHSGESVSTGAFLRFGTTIYRVRSSYLSDDRYIIAETDELDSGSRKAITITGVGTYNIITDTLDAASISTYGISLEMPKFYKLRDSAESRELPGDVCVFVAKSVVTPKVNTTFTMDSKTWRVVTVVDELDAWALHSRLA